METSVNNKCKAFTSLEQSKVLVKFLPIESADMEYMFLEKDNSMVGRVPFVKDGYEEPDCGYNVVPCWSLASLLNVLPNGIIMHKDSQNGKYHCSSAHIGTYVKADNPVDACYEMILKLHELKKL